MSRTLILTVALPLLLIPSLTHSFSLALSFLLAFSNWLTSTFSHSNTSTPHTHIHPHTQTLTNSDFLLCDGTTFSISVRHSLNNNRSIAIALRERSTFANFSGTGFNNNSQKQNYKLILLAIYLCLKLSSLIYSVHWCKFDLHNIILGLNIG